MAASKKRRYQARETGASRGASRRVLKNMRSRRFFIKYTVNFPLAPPVTGGCRSSAPSNPVAGGCQSSAPSTPVAGGCQSSAKEPAAKNKAELQQAPTTPTPVAGGCQSSAKGNTDKNKVELQQAPTTPNPVAGGCQSSAKEPAAKNKAELQQAPATPGSTTPPPNPPIHEIRVSREQIPNDYAKASKVALKLAKTLIPYRDQLRVGLAL